MADVFTVGGVTLDPTLDDFVPLRFSERFGTNPSLTLQRRGIALPGLPDPWLGKTATWTHNSTLYFTGDVVSVVPLYTAIGWTLTYQCLGFRNRLDWFPHTDSNSGIDTSTYNLMLEDPNYIPARAGRTVGQVLTDVLTMADNATAIDAAGLGGYTSLSPPTLPTATVADLAALDMIVPRPVYFTGEKLGSAIDGFLQQWAPNHRFWVQPDGKFRVMDLRAFTPQTLTMGTDPIEPTELSRDVGDCFQRVEVRGQPIAVLGVLKQSLGKITQNFGHDGLTNAAAISAWNPNQFRQMGTAQDVGTCTCPTTTTITVTSADPTATWVANFWDQTHQQGTVNPSSSTITGVTQFWQARVVSNTALSAGGTSTLTIDNPLPSTAYDHYTITGLGTGGSVVWTQYQIADSSLWTKVVKQTTYPQPFIGPNGDAVARTSTAIGVVLWSNSGSPPYTTFPLQFTYNPVTGNVRFLSPTYFTANNAPPADVWVALPIQTNPNVAIEPPDLAGVPQYAGTSHTIDGLTKTLTIDAPYWRDPGQLAQVQAYTSNVLDSVKDASIEGAVVYYGFFADALTFGLALNVAGDDGAGAYTTGWESAALPVIGVDIEWPQGEGMDYRTTAHCSNRKQALSSAMFMHPERDLAGNGGGFNDSFNPFNIAQPEMMADSQGNYQAMAEAAKNGQIGGPVQLGTGNQTSLGDSGFGMADIAAAGADNGGGIHDAATDPDRKVRSRNGKDIGDTRLRMPKDAAEKERIADLGDQALQPDLRTMDLGINKKQPDSPEEQERIRTLGDQALAPDLRIMDLGVNKKAPDSPEEQARIANLGNNASGTTDRIRNLGVNKRQDDPDEAKRIAKLGLGQDDDEDTGG